MEQGPSVLWGRLSATPSSNDCVVGRPAATVEGQVIDPCAVGPLNCLINVSQQRCSATVHCPERGLFSPRARRGVCDGDGEKSVMVMEAVFDTDGVRNPPAAGPTLVR